MNHDATKICNPLALAKHWVIRLILLVAAFLTADAMAVDAPRVILKTTAGDITVEIDPNKAPKSAENFLRYVKDGHYNGTLFHRVIKNFMVQAGGFDKEMRQKPTREPVTNEAKNGLRNSPYTIAMARTGDPHSATAQFFINTGNNRFLDFPGQDGWGYTVFGKVVDGRDVVDRINNMDTRDDGMHQNVPTKPIIIESASIVK